MGLIDKESFRKRFFELNVEFRPSQIDAVFDCLNNSELVDAEQVIRCKNCKYMTEHYDTDGNAPYWTCSEWDSGTEYDGFCHYAERKEE